MSSKIWLAFIVDSRAKIQKECSNGSAGKGEFYPLQAAGLRKTVAFFSGIVAGISWLPKA